jgi:hypothetical protein
MHAMAGQRVTPARQAFGTFIGAGHQAAAKVRAADGVGGKG